VADHSRGLSRSRSRIEPAPRPSKLIGLHPSGDHPVHVSDLIEKVCGDRANLDRLPNADPDARKVTGEVDPEILDWKAVMVRQ
jgi:hypothetical protein